MRTELDIIAERDFAKEVAMAEGRAEGWEEGLEAGRAEGLEAGRAEGLEAGREEGLIQGRNNAILSLRQFGMSPEDISRALDLPLKEVLSVLK